jgi:uncharacterized protein YdaL
MTIKYLIPIVFLAFTQIIKAQNLNTTNSINFKQTSAEKSTEKKVLIVADSALNLNSYATVNAKQLNNLLGHFKTTVKVLGINQYTPHKIDNYDIVFYIGQHHTSALVPFMNDVYQTKKTVVWINNGMMEFEKYKKTTDKYGFNVVSRDTSVFYNSVKSGKNFLQGKMLLYIWCRFPTK